MVPENLKKEGLKEEDESFFIIPPEKLPVLSIEEPEIPQKVFKKRLKKIKKYKTGKKDTIL